MSSCAVCGTPIDEPHFTDPATGTGLHPACLARGAAEDALVTVLGLLALTLVPPIVVWAA